MTDRRTGGLGANADVRVDPQRQAGAVGVMVDAKVQNVREIPISAVFRATSSRSIPLTAALLQTLERSIPLAAALRSSRARSVSISARFSVSASRSIPLTAALVLVGATERRTGALGVAADVQVNPQRQLGAFGVVVDVQTGLFRSIPLTAELLGAAVTTSSRSIIFDAIFVQEEPPPDPTPDPPAALVTSACQIPFRAQLGARLTVPLSMPVALSPLPPTDYEYLWSVPDGDPLQCVSVSVSIPNSPADDPIEFLDAPSTAIYARVQIGGSAPEGAVFVSQAHYHPRATTFAYQIMEQFRGYVSWSPWSAEMISEWHDLGMVNHGAGADSVRGAVFGGLETPRIPGSYTATICFTFRKRQDPLPDHEPCAAVQLTTDWYRTSRLEHFSPPVPYSFDAGLPVPWQAHKFRIWYLPFEGDVSTGPFVAVRNYTPGSLTYFKDFAEYHSSMPTRGASILPYYVSNWLEPDYPPLGDRMTGLDMVIATDNQNAIIPYHQGQSMQASVIIEWDCDTTRGIPINAVFTPRERLGGFVQIVG